jgi:hypothetical protein
VNARPEIKFLKKHFTVQKWVHIPKYAYRLGETDPLYQPLMTQVIGKINGREN